MAPHPLLVAHWSLGVNATNVCWCGEASRVMLVMLAEDGLTGLTRRSAYSPPEALFDQAVRAMVDKAN